MKKSVFRVHLCHVCGCSLYMSNTGIPDPKIYSPTRTSDSTASSFLISNQYFCSKWVGKGPFLQSWVEILQTLQNKIRTHKRFKRTLFLGTKYNLQIAFFWTFYVFGSRLVSAYYYKTRMTELQRCCSWLKTGYALLWGNVQNGRMKYQN